MEPQDSCPNSDPDITAESLPPLGLLHRDGTTVADQPAYHELPGCRVCLLCIGTAPQLQTRRPAMNCPAVEYVFAARNSVPAKQSETRIGAPKCRFEISCAGDAYQWALLMAACLVRNWWGPATHTTENLLLLLNRVTFNDLAD